MLSLPKEALMNTGKTIFAQVMDFLPRYEFQKCVQRYRGHYKVKQFTCLDQFLCMAFAQMTYRESLRDIEACLRSMRHRLYHMGICSQVSRNTLANANNQRDWRIYADFAQVLIHQARKLYINEDLGLELDQTVYALDATTIDLCLSLFPWAHFRKTKSAVKLHTLLDLKGPIPYFIWITDGRVHEVNILDRLVPEPSSFYLFDRAYLDWNRLYRLHQAHAFFVMRAKKNLKVRRLYSQDVDKTKGLRSDQTVMLTIPKSKVDYPEKFRRIRFFDTDNQRHLVFLTNNFSLPAQTIPQLYKQRWQIELFFKWIKQHLRIKAFYGTSQNAVKTQIWIAISVYVLVTIIKKQLDLKQNLYTILQILSVTAFEKTPLIQAFARTDYMNPNIQDHNQLNLFDL
jgi:hypothetical protein